MIKINLYVHFVTIDEEQHKAIWNVQRILSVYTSSVYFRNFIIDYFSQLFFIFYYGYTSMYCFRNKQILNYVIKTTVLV